MSQFVEFPCFLHYSERGHREKFDATESFNGGSYKLQGTFLVGITRKVKPVLLDLVGRGKHSTTHKTPPQTKSYVPQNITSAQLRNRALEQGAVGAIFTQARMWPGFWSSPFPKVWIAMPCPMSPTWGKVSTNGVFNRGPQTELEGLGESANMYELGRLLEKSYNKSRLLLFITS